MQQANYTVRSVSRKGPFPTELFVDWILVGVLLIVCRVDVLLILEAVGAREYCCMAVENVLEALYFVRSPRATRSSCATSTRPRGWVALELTQSRQSYVRGTALSREQSQLQQA